VKELALTAQDSTDQLRLGGCPSLSGTHRGQSILLRSTILKAGKRYRIADEGLSVRVQWTKSQMRWSVSTGPKAGILLRRMPFLMIQNNSRLL